MTVVKCHLLGWWADKTKGYRLEDIETKKLITARDICVIEDDKPMDVAIIEDEAGHPTLQTTTGAPDLLGVRRDNNSTMEDEGSEMLDPMEGNSPALPRTDPAPL